MSTDKFLISVIAVLIVTVSTGVLLAVLLFHCPPNPPNIYTEALSTLDHLLTLEAGAVLGLLGARFTGQNRKKKAAS